MRPKDETARHTYVRLDESLDSYITDIHLETEHKKSVIIQKLVKMFWSHKLEIDEDKETNLKGKITYVNFTGEIDGFLNDLCEAHKLKKSKIVRRIIKKVKESKIDFK